MKATGIVRRIDDLGRVVIPKEIRRTMHIREGEPLEIFTTNEGEVLFKKYSPVGELATSAHQVAEVTQKVGGFACAICDRDHIVAVAGLTKKDYLERRITAAIEKVMEGRRPYQAGQSGALPEIKPIDEQQIWASTVVPILSGSDIAGAVIALTQDRTARPGETELKLVSMAAGFLGKQVDE